MATDKQVNCALMLLQQAGYSTKWMNSQFKELGATMRQRSGTVEDWLRSMNVAEASALIDQLKQKTEPAEKPPVDDKLTKAMNLLERAEKHLSDSPPDDTWFRDYFLLTGQHVILTDEGWEPGEAKASYEPDAILDELNAPIRHEKYNAEKP